MKKFKGNAIQRKSIQGGMGLFFGAQVSKQFDDKDGDGGGGENENEEVLEQKANEAVMRTVLALMKPTNKWIRAATRRKSSFWSKVVLKEDNNTQNRKRSILIKPSGAL